MLKKQIYIIMSVVLALTLVVPITEAYAQEASDWALESIEKALEENLIVLDDLDKLQAIITREDFVEIIMKLYTSLDGKDVDLSDSLSFVDTQNAEVIKAYHLGIVNGIGEGKFAPNEHVTREQAIVILHRLLDALEIYPITTMEYILFEDEDEISDWAKNSFQLMYKLGVVKGVGEGYVAPEKGATVEQALVMAVRLMEAAEMYSE
jgi:hypothetical protein